MRPPCPLCMRTPIGPPGHSVLKPLQTPSQLSEPGSLVNTRLHMLAPDPPFQLAPDRDGLAQLLEAVGKPWLVATSLHPGSIFSDSPLRLSQISLCVLLTRAPSPRLKIDPGGEQTPSQPGNASPRLHPVRWASLTLIARCQPWAVIPGLARGSGPSVCTIWSQ